MVYYCKIRKKEKVVLRALRSFYFLPGFPLTFSFGGPHFPLGLEFRGQFQILWGQCPTLTLNYDQAA